MKAAVQELPDQAGLDLADWNWKVVRQFVQQRFDADLGRSTCLNYLHRPGFVLKRPKKRLVKASAKKRAGLQSTFSSACRRARICSWAATLAICGRK